MIFFSTDGDLEKTRALRSINAYKLQVGYGRVDGRPRAQAPDLDFVLHAILMAVHGCTIF